MLSGSILSGPGAVALNPKITTAGFFISTSLYSHSHSYSHSPSHYSDYADAEDSKLSGHGGGRLRAGS